MSWGYYIILADGLDDLSYFTVPTGEYFSEDDIERLEYDLRRTGR